MTGYELDVLELGERVAAALCDPWQWWEAAEALAALVPGPEWDQQVAVAEALLIS